MSVRTRESFIKLANEKYGGKFDYSKVVYVDSVTKIEIICPIHGSFWQRPVTHIRSRAIVGCYKCRILKGGKILVWGEDGKTCSKCKKFLSFDNFYKCHTVKSGYSSACKECNNISSAKWKAENEEFYRESTRARSLKQYYKLKELGLVANKPRQPRSDEKIINEKIGRNCRSRIRQSLKGIYRAGGSEELLGCTFDIARKHIESLFTDGMNWDNWNYYGWHLDHIIPICSFNLSNPEEQKRCFHYTNLQPLWREPNQEKGSKYNGKNYKK